jgi:hypothetical protein
VGGTGAWGFYRSLFLLFIGFQVSKPIGGRPILRGAYIIYVFMESILFTTLTHNSFSMTSEEFGEEKWGG